MNNYKPMTGGELLPIPEGKLTILDEWPVKGGKRQSRVLCFCGVEFVARTDSLKTKNTTSCGCRKEHNFRIARYVPCKHRHSGKKTWKTGHSPTYTSWNSMKNRCLNPKHKNYNRYGGRGIKIVECWVNDFSQFLKDMGEKPGKGYSIDRIDNEGDYEPSNCQWMTIGENSKKAHQLRKKNL